MRIRSFLPALLLALAPARIDAQVVTGFLLEAETRAPIEGALVSLLEGERRVTIVFTDGNGAFALRAPSPGRYRLRAERIGFDTETTGEIEIPAAGIGGYEFAVRTRAVELDGIEVSADARCGRRDDGSEVARVWDEARKALDAVLVSERTEMVRLAVVSWSREVDAETGRAANERRGARSARHKVPLRSLPPDDLAADGYVRVDAQGIDWFAPDAEVLLSDSFQATHCFSLTEDEADPTRIGLAFRPLASRGPPDIEGTLWLHRSTAELDELEYRYARLPWPVSDRSIGGRVSFERIAGGPWIVDDWHVRMPLLVRPMQANAQIRIGGFIEQGDQVVDIRSAAASAAADAIVARAEEEQRRAREAERQAAISRQTESERAAQAAADSVAVLAAAGLAAASMERDSVVDLPGIEVAAEARSASLARVGFYERMASTRGAFLTREDIERRRPSLASHALENVPGIRTRDSRYDGMLVWFSGNEKATLSGIDICGPRLLINGLEVHQGGNGAPLPIDRYVSVPDIAAIEVYRSAAQLPPQYGGAHAACGVILIWTM